MDTEYDLDQIIQHLNQLAELLEDNEHLRGREEINDFVQYWSTLIETSVALNIGWVELTESGTSSLVECYRSLEDMCPGGVEYFLEYPLDCSLNKFTR